MQKYLDSLVSEGAAGVLLHYRSPEQTWIGSSGRAELGTDRPVDPEGWFRAGSITKTFTAVVVLQLVGEGKLRLDDPVGRWVPGVPDIISLRQLLNHTSGLYNYTGDLPDTAGIVRDRFRRHEPLDVLGRGLAKPRLFEPGGQWSYSNTNYIALGLLVEAVTGNSYGDGRTSKRRCSPWSRTMRRTGTGWASSGDDCRAGRFCGGTPVDSSDT